MLLYRYLNVWNIWSVRSTCAILSNTTYYSMSYFTSRDWTWNATKEELRMIKLIQNGKFVRKGQVINRYFWIVLRFDKLSVSSTVTNMSLLCALKWVFSNTHFEALLSTMTKIYEWSQFPITWRKLNFSKEKWRKLFSVEVEWWQWYLTTSLHLVFNCHKIYLVSPQFSINLTI